MEDARDAEPDLRGRVGHPHQNEARETVGGVGTYRYNDALTQAVVFV